MRCADHITLARLASTAALLLAAVSALAQPPDTLRIAPCQLASLPVAVDVSPATGWIERRFDRMTLAGIIARDDVTELAKVGESIAPDPLIEFAAIAVAIGDSANNLEIFRRKICATYPAYDCEYDIDPELLGLAFSLARDITKTTKRSMIVMAARADSSTDSVPILVTFTTEAKVVVDTLYVIENAAHALSENHTGGREVIPLAIHKPRAPWSAKTDSAAISRWLGETDVANVSLHRLPLREEMRRAFIDMRIRPLQRVIHDLLISDMGPVGDEIILALLDSLGTDTTFTSRTLGTYLKRLICSRYSEFDCEYDVDVSGEFTDSIRAIIPHYLALPDRVYAVVEEKRVRGLILFPAVTSRRSPIMLTPEEMSAHPLMEGTDWQERLMRSIREEECWAERMEGF